MKDIATIFWAIRLVLLVLVVIAAVVAALMLGRKRKYAPWRDVVFAIAAPIAVIAMAWQAGVHFSIVWAAVLGVLGVVAGYFAGRGSTFVVEDGTLKLRRSPVGPWLWAVAVIVAALTALFGSSYLFALAMLLLVFAACEVVGQSIAELTQAKPGTAGTGVPAAPLPEAGAPAVTA
jgi:hypothetical protein